MAVNTQTLKTFLRLAPNDTQDLTLYLNAAVAKATAAGVTPRASAQYELLIYSLAAMYYDCREFDVDPAAQAMINAFILELRYTEPEPEPEPEPEGDADAE